MVKLSKSKLQLLKNCDYSRLRRVAAYKGWPNVDRNIAILKHVVETKSILRTAEDFDLSSQWISILVNDWCTRIEEMDMYDDIYLLKESRTYKRAGYTKLKDFENCKMSDISKIRNIGPKAIDNLKKILDENNVPYIKEVE